jgi:phenylalanyl-tRNA synthetase beta chain
MLISLNWLRDYVAVDVEPARLAEDLTMLGLNVEGLEHRPNPFAELRIGRVLTCEKHPNADRLTVCTVDIGEATARDIVCGAPNVREGLEVAVIPAGASLPDGTLIRKGKIRGALSMGMICSAIELGIGADADGIMELDLDVAPGTPLAEHFGEEDWIIDIEVTPNRPDQLGYLGIAREIAALYELELKLPDTTIPDASLADLEPVEVEVQDPEGCPRYVARRLADLQVGPSPDWLCRRLLSAGLRPINNVVDVTNYVLYETGHPLHAFDADKLAEGRIIVRRAEPSEKTLTLDEAELELNPRDLLIADAKLCIAVAGVMGGHGSRVEETSRELILESALFEPGSIRETRRRHDLSTDSSYRFERGAAFTTAAFASERAAKLFAEICGARVGRLVTDVAAPRDEAREITLRIARVNGLLGTELSADTLRSLLARFEIPATIEGEVLRITVPDFRRDLLAEVDLIEEIARLHGYGKLPGENRVRNSLHGRLGADEKGEERLHGLMTGLGCQEVLTSSFMDLRQLDAMGLGEDDPRRSAVLLRNPLVSFNSVLRSSLLPGMLEVLKTNFHRGQEELRIYQYGRVYLGRDGEPLPDEPRQLALLMSGHLDPANWSLPAAPLMLGDLTGIAAALADEAGREFRFEYGEADPYFSPGVCFRIYEGDTLLGQGGLLQPSLLKDLKQKREIFYLEMFQALGQTRHASYEALPSYPASRRDLALLVPDGVRWEQVRECLEQAGGKWLESCELFDVYRGEGVPTGQSSCAVRLNFRSREGTLTDKQVDKQSRRVLERLDKTLKVGLRS